MAHLRRQARQSEEKCLGSLWALAASSMPERMPQGTICQLHYLGGGTVEFQEASGSRVRRPFLHAPPLRIGQEVRFTVSSAGEAFQIEVLQPGVAKGAGMLREAVEQKAGREGKRLVEAKRHAEAEAFSSQRPAWRLQRCIRKFWNASPEERLDMLSRAELALKQLLRQADLDGDAICRLVRKVVGWLQAPRFLKQMTGASGGTAQAQAGNAGDLQCRVRRLLISALSNLDVMDGTTSQAVETAVAYIAQLIQDVCFADLETSRAARDWQQLQALIQGGAISPADGAKKTLRSERLKGEERARVVAGDFLPNIRVRQLHSVFPGDAVRLTCPSCPRSISSRWWWRHPKTQVPHLLIPSSGCYHGGARGRRVSVDATSRWHPADASLKVKGDCLSNLDFCHHKRVRADCKECGGYMICSHGKRRPLCHQCKPKAEKLRAALALPPHRVNLGDPENLTPSPCLPRSTMHF